MTAAKPRSISTPTANRACSLTPRPAEREQPRRQCLAEGCPTRFTTYERIEHRFLVVLKKDGRRQAFDRDKIRRGLVKACTKRPITPERIEQTVDEIEAELRHQARRQVPVTAISELILERL